MIRIKALIFDFDGVIAESVDVKTAAFAILYQGYGNDVQEKVIAHHMAHGGVSRYEKFRYYHRQFLNQEISDLEMKTLSEDFSRRVLQKVIEAPYVKGAKEFITAHHKDYAMFISSGTQEEEIQAIVRARSLSPFFRDIFGAPAKKSEHVKKILSAHDFNKNEVVFIGDALSDKEAAEENEIVFITRLTPDSSLGNEHYVITDLSCLSDILNLLEHK